MRDSKVPRKRQPTSRLLKSGSLGSFDDASPCEVTLSARASPARWKTLTLLMPSQPPRKYHLDLRASRLGNHTCASEHSGRTALTGRIDSSHIPHFSATPGQGPRGHAAVTTRQAHWFARGNQSAVIPALPYASAETRPCARKGVGVQLPPRAQEQRQRTCLVPAGHFAATMVLVFLPFLQVIVFAVLAVEVAGVPMVSVARSTLPNCPGPLPPVA